MAPPKQHTIDRTEEWQKFIHTLTNFHADRGTKFDPEPKVTQVTIDLLKLYKYVIDKGGYDKLAIEKNIWLSVAQDLGIGAKTGVAFNLKSTYYKNLAAYEIQVFHGKTPPPKEILEDVTAAGGNILGRTLENYQPKRPNNSAQGSREPSHDVGTPARDTKVEEGGTPNSSRAQRGLRSAPAQRQMFQPDTSSSRSVNNRHVSNQRHGSPNSDTSRANQSNKMDPHAHSNGHHQAPNLGRHLSQQMNNYPSAAHAPQLHAARGGASASYQPQNFDSHSVTVTAFQPPGPQQPLVLRPVETPVNAPSKFVSTPHVAAPAAPRQAPTMASKLMPLT